MRRQLNRIGVDHLPLAIRSFYVGEQPPISKSPSLSLDESLKRLELRLIDEAIERAGGNRAEAARRLGISRARLLRRLGDGNAAIRRLDPMNRDSMVNVAVPDTDRLIPWLICPGRDRWLRGSLLCRRNDFRSQLRWPSNRPIQRRPVTSCSGRCQAVVLWDVSTEHLGSWCTWIAKTAIESPQALQLAATTNLSVAEQAILSELGIVAMIRHPEQLPALGNLIRKYLASAGDWSRQSATDQ